MEESAKPTRKRTLEGGMPALQDVDGVLYRPGIFHQQSKSEASLSRAGELPKAKPRPRGNPENRVLIERLSYGAEGCER